MKYLIMLFIFSITTLVPARTVTISSKEGSIVINIPNISKDGKVKTRNILKIIKDKLEKLEYDYISRLGRYERRGAASELKAIKILIAKLPNKGTILLSGTEKVIKPKKPVTSFRAMTNQDFNKLLRSIKIKRFSSDKLSTIKNAAFSNYFTMNQLIRLIKIFRKIDSRERLEVVKAVYPKVIHKRNGYLVFDLFPFSSDKEKVKRILRRYK